MSSSRFDSCNFSKEVSEDTTDSWDCIILNINPQNPQVHFQILSFRTPEVKIIGTGSVLRRLPIY